MKTHATRHVQSDAMHTFALNLEMQKILGSFQPDPDLDWIYMRKRPPAAEAFLNTVVRTVNAVRDLGTVRTVPVPLTGSRLMFIQTRRLFLDQCNEIGPALANIYNTVNKRMAEGYIPWLPEAVTTYANACFSLSPPP